MGTRASSRQGNERARHEAKTDGKGPIRRQKDEPEPEGLRERERERREIYQRRTVKQDTFQIINQPNSNPLILNRPANADEDQEDEEILMYAASSRLNRPGNQDTTSGFQRDHDERNIPYSTGYNRQSNYRQVVFILVDSHLKNHHFICVFTVLKPYDSSDRSRGDNSAQSRSKPGPSTSRGGPEQRRPASPPQRGGKSRADEWHDPWDK